MSTILLDSHGSGTITHNDSRTYYDVIHKRIVSPGKFEGEHFAVVELYNRMLDGLSDPIQDVTGGSHDILDLSPEDRERFQLDDLAHYAVLHYSDYGFVSVEFMDTEGLDQWRDRIDAEFSEQDEDEEEAM